MIATVTNLSSTASVFVPEPFNVTIAASGNVALGVSTADLLRGEDKGRAAWRRLDGMIQRAEITIAYAADAQSVDTVDAGNEV